MTDAETQGAQADKRIERGAAQRRASEEAIISAAYRCFERYGIRKTNMDDIAQEAAVSRATLYRHFPNKEALVDRISVIETGKAHQEIRQLLKERGPFAQTLVECLFHATRIAQRNPHIRPLVEFSAVAGRAATPSSASFEASRKTWGRLLDDAIVRDELAPDITPDELTGYLVLSLAMLLTKVDAMEVSDVALRHFIRRFVVDPLLPGARG